MAAAYHDMLGSLIREAAGRGVLAHLALVPLTALFMAWVLVRKAPPPRPIHDRQVDYIVGIGLLGLAIAIGMIAITPETRSAEDHGLRSLALLPALAGCIAIIHGVRRLWTVRAAILFLLAVLPVTQAAAIAALFATLGDAMPEAMAAASVAAAFLIVGSGVVAVADGGPIRRVMLLVAGACLAFVLALSASWLGLPVSASGIGVTAAATAVDLLLILLPGAVAWPIGHRFGVRVFPVAPAPSGAPAVLRARPATAAVVVAVLAIRWLGGDVGQEAADNASGVDERSAIESMVVDDES